MPVWHAQTKDLQEAGQVQMLGIIQEQHPDRARLFMQWQRMGWPILVDALNLLGVDKVPITFAIDEHGIIRHAGLRTSRADDIARIFLNRTYDAPPTSGPDPARAAAITERPTDDTTDPAVWAHYARSVFLWGDATQLDDAVIGYERALGTAQARGPLHFRLGVVHRRRYDSPHRQHGDFARAVHQWGAALATDPNQYIWRRRIQQYGPRQDKPYPFYDWVTEARREILARGETPVALAVEPDGAEIAQPAKRFVGKHTAKEPDPDGRIHRDPARFVTVETTVVPDTTSRRASARVHLVFRPNAEQEAHWNNEAGDLMLWVNPPAGWEVDRRLLTVPNPPGAVSTEPRRIEFELRGPSGKNASDAVVEAYALYYVCEDIDGVCLYRRQDIAVTMGGGEPGV